MAVETDCQQKRSSQRVVTWRKAAIFVLCNRVPRKTAADITGTIGCSKFSELSRKSNVGKGPLNFGTHARIFLTLYHLVIAANDIMRRVQYAKVRTLAEHYPLVEPGCLLEGKGPMRLQKLWNMSGSKDVSTLQWIF